MPYIACDNVAFAYEGNTVIRELNFQVNPGNYLCIVGENGSGKSTLIKGLLNLKQPSSGSIQTGEGLQPGEIGYLPQQTVVQKDFPASVIEVVLSGRLSSCRFPYFYKGSDRIIANRNMELLGISDLKNRCYRELSGGQQQRVLLARALCATGKLLLMDEPVTGLDPVITQGLYETVAGLNRDSGITIIMVSHDIHSAVKYASHVLHVQNRQRFFGPTADYLQTDLAKRFMGGGFID